MKKIFLLISLVFVLMMSACKPALPDDVLSRGDMRDILYDIHLSHFIPQDGYSSPAYENVDLMYARQLEILRKHGVTEAEWEHSMDYYTRHADLLRQIYADLYEDVSEEAMAMGISVGGVASANSVDDADSTNVWNNVQNFVLTSQPPYTFQTWEQELGDSVIGKGERITFSFFSMFVSERAEKRLTAVVAATLDNDSIIQASSNMSMSSRGTVTITVPADRSVKKIKGMFVLLKENAHNINVQQEAQQVVLISNIKLLHTPQMSSANNQSGAAVTPVEELQIRDEIRQEPVRIEDGGDKPQLKISNDSARSARALEFRKKHPPLKKFTIKQ